MLLLGGPMQQADKPAINAVQLARRAYHEEMCMDMAVATTQRITKMYSRMRFTMFASFSLDLAPLKPLGIGIR
jgi:hypothetical protein